MPAGEVGFRPVGREPRLSELARWVIVPDGIVTTGWPPVLARCAEMGLSFDLWQDGIGQLALGKRGDGQYAATEGAVVVSIPRQTGKTYLFSAMAFALCTLHADFTVVWTAHRSRTSDETFRNMQGMAGRPGIAPHVAAVRVANGQQTIEFTNGSRILFGAREQGFGRGFAQIDLLILDEAQILGQKALEDLVPATNASVFPAGGLVVMMGTPPRPVDPGEAYTSRRADALAQFHEKGHSDDTVYVEFSADKQSDPDDEAQWMKANPSFPQRTRLSAIRRMRKLLANDDSFLREALGIWGADDVQAVIDSETWRKAGDSSSMPTEHLALGVDVAPDLAWASVCLAGLREDGDWHVEIDDSRKGADWVVPHIANLLEKNDGKIRAVVVDQYSPAAPLMDGFKEARVRVTSPKLNDIGTACARLFEGVTARTVHHINQPPLDVAVSVARKRPLGTTGMWAWSRKNTTSDITPVVAATLALWGAQTNSDRVTRPQRKTAAVKVRYL